MMDREKAFQIIWDRCQHSKETEEALKVLKEERPHGEWIPCFERLPKDCEIVLASFKTGVVQMCKYFDSGRDDSWWSYKDDCFAWDNTVVAWMPLPEPYKEEGESN